MLRAHWNDEAKAGWREDFARPPAPTGLQAKRRMGGRADRPSKSSALLRQAIRIVDRLLRRWQGVFEFTSHRRCVLRIALRRMRTTILLADGMSIARGSHIAELHLWNEQFVPPPQAGPNFAWVNGLRRQVITSLAELAAYSERDPIMGEVVAFRARVAFASAGRRQKMARIARRFGFERPMASSSTRLGQQIHDFFDNIWLVGLVWTFNPRALRGRRIARYREEFWISRSALVGRFGSKD